MISISSKALSLLSGGLDSFVSLALAHHSLDVIQTLTFDYGQRAAAKEIEAAKKISQHFNLPHHVIGLPWLAELGSNALTHRDQALPIFKNLAALTDDTKTKSSAQAVWVPNRNGIFLNIAAALAESQGADWVLTGFNKEEAATFPDNTAEYVTALNHALGYSTLNKVKIKSFVQEMTKKEMVRTLKEMGLPLNMTWSCYEGNSTPCGVCESCARYENALS